MARSRPSEGDFFALLTRLREFRAGQLGADASSRALAKAAEVSPTTIGHWLSGDQFPQDIEKFLRVVRFIALRAAAYGIGELAEGVAAPLDEERWRAAYRMEATRRADVVTKAVEGAQAARALAPPPMGRLLTEVSDPFALEVHRPLQPEGSSLGLPVLPTYVLRDHDGLLAAVTRGAAEGSSGVAVMVGASSTGKTRACWEALGLLRELPNQWRLWHPIDPSRPEAALRDLHSIGPRTVIWLNDAQFYLDAADGMGEKIAAGLRELQRDRNRGPVLLLATLWPQFWETLTTRPPAGEDDLHAQARQLLSGWDISVPNVFTEAQMRQISHLGDPRLVLAAETARDGQVTQFLAGAPELLARYNYAPPAAKALISAAMDARRLGMGMSLPLGFLERAAPGYLTENEWDGLGDDWLEQALAYADAGCKGARGPLTRIRPRPSRAGSTVPGGAYRLADYLDQHGRRARHSLIPPTEFWTAAIDLTDSTDLGALTRAAEGYGLIPDTKRLYKAAAAKNSANVDAVRVAGLPPLIPPDDLRARVSGHAGVHDPYVTAKLLDALRVAGADHQVQALLARDPAAHASLGDPYATARLLDALRMAGAEHQVQALLARDPAAHTPVSNPYATARLLDALRAAGADDQVQALLARDPAAHTDLSSSYAIARLLDALRKAGANNQIEALLARNPAAHADLGNPSTTAHLLTALQAAGADGQVEALLARNPAAHADLGNPKTTAYLLDALRAAGADDQVQALLARDPAAHADLTDPISTVNLLDALRAAGADDQVQALLARDPAGHADLTKPGLITNLLKALRLAGADHQVQALLARDPAAHANLTTPGSIANLLNALRLAGAEHQVAALLARDPAAHADLTDQNSIANLLDALRAAGADDQVQALLARDSASGPAG